MTYGSFSNGSVYKAHLDSKDFLRFLQWTASLALALSMLFSVRGNVLGLSQFISGNWFFTAAIAIGITVTSALLSMLTVFRLPGLNRTGRIMIAIAAMALFYSSVKLTQIGFRSDETKIKQISTFNNPEIVNLNQELRAIIDRQKDYDLTPGQRQSLLAREKEQRARIREVEDRLRMEGKKETGIEQAVGSEAMVARMIFALAPDLSIMVLSPLLVVLFGLAGFNQVLPDGSGREPERQVIYLPMNQGQASSQGQGQASGQGSGQAGRVQVQSYQVRQPEPDQRQRQPVEMNQGNGGNGHVNQGQGPGREQLSFGWDPFNGQ